MTANNTTQQAVSYDRLVIAVLLFFFGGGVAAVLDEHWPLWLFSCFAAYVGWGFHRHHREISLQLARGTLKERTSGYRESLSRPLRRILGLGISGGGALLLFLATILMTSDWSKWPHPAAGVPLAIAIGSLGSGIAYTGVRLTWMNEQDPLFGPHASRIAGAFMIILGLTTVVASLYFGVIDFPRERDFFVNSAAAGIFFVSLGLGVVRTARVWTKR
jgi:hypothetical protein